LIKFRQDGVDASVGISAPGSHVALVTLSFLQGGISDG
jgi:hypothetical protein